jgi:hypothetical protein
MGWVEKPQGMRREEIRWEGEGQGQRRDKVVVDLVGVSSCAFFLRLRLLLLLVELR